MTPPLSGAADFAVSTDSAARPAPAELPTHTDLRVVPLGAVRRHDTSRYEHLVKPLVDRLVALVLLVTFLPIMLLCAVAVAASLGRPVLLRQPRIGYQGKSFLVYKFRTMHQSRRSHRLDYVGPERRKTHKHPQDPRLTPLGRFLRTWSLDELPQLLNVVRGEMSLVGPRPEMVDIVERYEPWQHQRHQVKPGITGLWQVSARGDAPMHELTQVDLEYLDRVSFTTDLKILLLTVPAALGVRRGF